MVPDRTYLRLLLLAAALILSGGLQAQDPHFNHYTEDQELPSNEVYNIVLDENNILHMATDRGLVIYDGYTFRTYTTMDGLEDNCILRINKDRLNRIWLTTIQNSSNYVENGQIFKSYFSDSLKQEDPHGHFVQHIFAPTAEDLLINFNYPGLFKIKESGSLERYTSHLEDAGDATLCIIQTPTGYTWDLVNYPEIAPDGKTTWFKKDNRLYIKTSLTRENAHHRKEMVVVAENEFFFSYSTKVFHFKNDSLLHEVDYGTDILSMNYDKRSNDLWVGVDHAGAHRYTEANLKRPPKIYLNNESVSSMLRDHEGNYWFATKNNGVFRANSLDHMIFQVNGVYPGDNRITALLSTESALYFGTFSGRLFKLSKTARDTYAIHELENFSSHDKIRNLFETARGTIIVLAGDLFEIDPSGELTGFKRYGSYPYEFLQRKDDTSMVSFTSGLSVFKGRKLVDKLNHHPGFLKVIKIMEAADDEIWLSSRSYGLFKWDGSGLPVKPAEMMGYETYRSNAMAMYQNHVLTAPYGFGLLALIPGDTLHITAKNSNLSSNMIDHLLVENDSIIWASTNVGINRIVFPEGLQAAPLIQQINTTSGLPSNRVYSTALFDGYIWAATGVGLVRIDQDASVNHRLSNPVIQDVLVNNSPQPFEPDLRLGTDYPYSIRFNFKTISYHQPHHLYYYYYLDGLDDPEEPWAMTTDLEIRYPALDHGKYTLYIHPSKYPNQTFRGLPDNQETSTILPIDIRTAFVDTTWYILIVIALISLLIALITWNIIQAMRIREKNKQRLLQAEKQALLSQMNPHFIFNSLNSIQHYIILEDADNANIYLAQFSRLIRKILDNSKKKWITLREEIETISLYLNLEKLRFEDHFDFLIYPDKQLDQNDILIPPMMVQPFIENAIWHGIMPLRKKGLLKISYTRAGDRMLIHVEDNGVGREQASKKKRISGHTPTGLRNVNERIILLNKLIKKDIHCNIIDLTNQDGTAGGTRVELSVPIFDKHAYHEG